jgi:hypothetical protein
MFWEQLGGPSTLEEVQISPHPFPWEEKLTFTTSCFSIGCPVQLLKVLF